MSKDTLTITSAELEAMIAKAVQAGKAQARGRGSYPDWNAALDKAREAGAENKGRLVKATFDPTTSMLVLAISVEKHAVKSASGNTYLCSMGTGKGPAVVEVEGLGRFTTRGLYLLAE